VGWTREEAVELQMHEIRLVGWPGDTVAGPLRFGEGNDACGRDRVRPGRATYATVGGRVM